MSVESIPIFLVSFILLFIGLRIFSREPYILKNGHLAVLIAFIYIYVLIIKTGFNVSLLDDILITIVILISLIKTGSFTVFNIQKMTVIRIVQNCLVMYRIQSASEKSKISIKGNPDSSFLVEQFIDVVQVIPKKINKLEFGRMIMNNIFEQIGKTTADRFSVSGLLFILAGLVMPFLWIYVFAGFYKK